MIVLTLALLTACIWYWLQPIIFTADSFEYVNAAKSIAGVDHSKFAYFRGPALPLLLFATGVATLHTFNWFILLQIALGVATTIILYERLRKISPSVGFLGIIVFISAFVGFVHSKAIMTEEIYLFAWCLCIDGALGYISAPSRMRLAQITIALLILTMTRAQGGFIAFVVLPFLLFCKPNRAAEIVIAGFIIFLVPFTYMQLHAAKTTLIEKQTVADVSALGLTNSTGKTLFVSVYWNAFRHMHLNLVHPENGPASRKMFAELHAYFSNPLNITSKADDPFIGKFVGLPNSLLGAIEFHPEDGYWWAIWNAMDERLGAGASDALLMKVAIEAILAYPTKIAVTYARNFFAAFVNNESVYVTAYPRLNSEKIGTSLSKELETSGDSTKYYSLANFLNLYFSTMRLILLLCVILLSKKLFFSQWRMQWGFCVLIILYNQIMVAMSGFIENRYTFYIFPLLIILATMGLSKNKTKN